jgi:hypothetical protein
MIYENRDCFNSQERKPRTSFYNSKCCKLEDETIADLFGSCQRWWILIDCGELCQEQIGATDFWRVIQKFAGAISQKFGAPEFVTAKRRRR